MFTARKEEVDLCDIIPDNIWDKKSHTKIFQRLPKFFDRDPDKGALPPTSFVPPG